MPELVKYREEFGDIAAEITELLIRKRMDYGDESLSRFGELGILIRAWDKMCRLVNLLWEKRGAEPQNESIEDTWRDLAGYAILALHARRYGPARTAGENQRR